MDTYTAADYRKDELAVKTPGTKHIKKYLKANIIVTLLFGSLSGLLFLFYPRIDDAPVLSLYMLFSSAALLYLGIHNINAINKYIKPIILLPLLFGGCMICGILKYFTGGVFDEPPGIILLGTILGISLFLIGSINLLKMLKLKNIEAVAKLQVCNSNR